MLCGFRSGRYVLEARKEATAGVLLPGDDDAAMATAAAFTDRIEAETGNDDAIIAYENYTTGDTDFSKQLEAISATGVKSVLLPGNITDSANIINQAADMGLDLVFLGDNDWSTDEFEKLLENDVSPDNIAFINFFRGEHAVTVSEESEKFIEAYKEKYGKDKEPPESVALGYDAYLIAIDAIDEADGDLSGKKLKEILAGANQFEGASGSITFNVDGDPIRTAYISTWKDGEMVSTYTVTP